MSTKGWIYYNGTDHGWNGPNGYVPPKPMTLCYCAECGPKLIPGFNRAPHLEGRGHWDTGFKCAPWRVGKPCNGCGAEI